jgi:fructose-specific phosphotransferase system IIC component
MAGNSNDEDSVKTLIGSMVAGAVIGGTAGLTFGLIIGLPAGQVWMAPAFTVLGAISGAGIGLIVGFALALLNVHFDINLKIFDKMKDLFLGNQEPELQETFRP